MKIFKIIVLNLFFLIQVYAVEMALVGLYEVTGREFYNVLGYVVLIAWMLFCFFCDFLSEHH